MSWNAPVARLPDTSASGSSAAYTFGDSQDDVIMAEIVNLRRARKDKARQQRESEADANRRRFGRSKAEKAADKEARDRSQRDIDGKKIDRD